MVQAARGARSSTPRRSNAVKQFVFDPAEIDHQPAPVKITYKYDFTIVEQMVKSGPQINFDGVVLERFKKRPLPRVAVKLVDQDGLTATTDDEGHFAFTRRAARQTQARDLQPQADDRHHRGDHRARQATDGEIPPRGEGRGGRRRRCRARAAHQEGGGRDPHPHGRSAAGPWHPGRHPQGGAEPPRRGPLVVRFRRAHRVGRGAQRDQGQRRRRRDPGPLPTWAASARPSTPIWCVRSICRRAPTAPSMAAASAAWSASTWARCPRTGPTATSRPTCSTPRR